MIRNPLIQLCNVNLKNCGITSLFQKNLYSFNIITDKMRNKQTQKQKQQIKDEIAHIANKPSFTHMDYRLRVNDQLAAAQKGLKAKFSSDNSQKQKSLAEEKKIFDAMYEEQLIEQIPIKAYQKQQISLVTQTKIEKVNQILKKVRRFKKMHLMLRSMKENGQQLPQDMQTLQTLYAKSGIEQSDPSRKYQKYQKRSRIQKARLLKWNRL